MIFPAWVERAAAALRHRLAILHDVSTERDRQIAKWGVQPLPQANALDVYSPHEELAKANCEMAMAEERCTHALVIAEEAAEGFAAAQAYAAAALRKEWVQLAACCVKAIEGLDADANAEQTGPIRVNL